jgi:hypothetical protein
MTHWKSIGVTATREGLTIQQLQWTEGFLKRNSTHVLHHGDCVGGDEELAIMFSKFGIYIIAHPGSTPALRAKSRYNDLTLPNSNNLFRNSVIVKSSALVIAYPKGSVEEIRSGTWFTIRYAKKENARIIIVGPDGKIL